MTVQLASRNHPAALKTHTAWTAGPLGAEPLGMAGAVIHVREGREIFAEGEETEMFYKVVSGVVRVCKFLNDGRRQIEAFHVAGDIFGFELSAAHILSAEAVSDCTLVSYRRRNVEMLAQKNHAVTQHLFEVAMQSLAQAQSHSLLLGRRGAAEKVAGFLLTWAAHSADHSTIHLAMTRQDIADYLGLTIESVSRSLSQIERDGIIAFSSVREFRIKNIDALEELAA